MLDTKGIKLDEVSHLYPRAFQTLGYDVLMDTDEMYKPKVISTFQLCINSVIALLKMKPGQYPSIPELGIDIEQYLHEYSDDNSIPKTITDKLNDQMNLLGITGITIQVFFDQTSDGFPALVVRIDGNEQLDYGDKMSPVLIGITYDQLNHLYTRVHYNNS